MKSNFGISDKWYDVLKWVALVVLPAIATFYLAINGIWFNSPYSDKIVSTIMAFDLFLGVMLGIVVYQYNKDAKIMRKSEKRSFSSLFTITSETYDVLKWIAQIAIPAIAILCSAIGEIWNIPYTLQIATTLTAIDGFMGLILQFSTETYNKEISAFTTAKVNYIKR
jgi:hypothetical protein